MPCVFGGGLRWLCAPPPLGIWGSQGVFGALRVSGCPCHPISVLWVVLGCLCSPDPTLVVRGSGGSLSPPLVALRVLGVLVPHQLGALGVPGCLTQPPHFGGFGVFRCPCPPPISALGIPSPPSVLWGSPSILALLSGLGGGVGGHCVPAAPRFGSPHVPPLWGSRGLSAPPPLLGSPLRLGVSGVSRPHLVGVPCPLPAPPGQGGPPGGWGGRGRLGGRRGGALAFLGSNRLEKGPLGPR